jgi:hypothetical protein
MISHLLQTMIESVLPAINTRSSLPILSKVLVTYNGPVLTLTGENLDMRITAKAILPEEAKSPWALCAKPQDMLLATQMRGRKGDIFLQKVNPTGNPDHIQLGLEIHPEGENDPAGILLEADSENEFPSDHIYEGDEIELHPKLISAVKTVAPCMSQDETRYILNGVYIDTHQNAVVACDGRRLACVKLTKGVIPKDLDVVLRKEMVAVLLTLPEDRPTSMRCLRNKEGKIERIEFSTSMSWGTLTISGKTNVGLYPNWLNVVPSDTQIGHAPQKSEWNLTALPPSEFLTAWEGITICPPEKTSAIKASFTHTAQQRGTKLLFWKGDRKGPSAAAEMQTDAIQPLKDPTHLNKKGTSFNPRFIDDMRQIFRNRSEPTLSPKPNICYWGGTHPLLAEAHLGSTIYIIMPMRYQD